MAFFGGGEVRGHLHPSLRAFIDCFCSPPMPKMYPRGGGPHDQDPQMMRDFREILKIKGQCEELEDARDKVHEKMDGAGYTGTGGSKSGGGGGLGLEEALESFMEEEGY